MVNDITIQYICQNNFIFLERSIFIYIRFIKSLHFDSKSTVRCISRKKLQFYVTIEARITRNLFWTTKSLFYLLQLIFFQIAIQEFLPIWSSNSISIQFAVNFEANFLHIWLSAYFYLSLTQNIIWISYDGLFQYYFIDCGWFV